MVWNYQDADCSLKKIYCVILYYFRHTVVPYTAVVQCVASHGAGFKEGGGQTGQLPGASTTKGPPQ